MVIRHLVMLLLHNAESGRVVVLIR